MSLPIAKSFLPEPSLCPQSSCLFVIYCTFSAICPQVGADDVKNDGLLVLCIVLIRVHAVSAAEAAEFKLTQKPLLDTNKYTTV